MICSRKFGVSFDCSPFFFIFHCYSKTIYEKFAYLFCFSLKKKAYNLRTWLFHSHLISTVFNTFLHNLIGVYWPLMYAFDSISENIKRFFKIFFLLAYYFWLYGVIGELKLFLTSGWYFMDPDWLSGPRIFAINDSIVRLDCILRMDVDLLFLFERLLIDGVNFFQGTWMVLFISDHFLHTIQILSKEES